MIVRISSESLDSINLNPETETEEVAQNAAALALTPEGSCPLLRGMGVAMTYKDRPTTIAAAVYEAELDAALTEWEPRATVTTTEGEADETEGWIVESLALEVETDAE